MHVDGIDDESGNVFIFLDIALRRLDFSKEITCGIVNTTADVG
jgi:hypothetical protein